jgi:hypothetical protein
MRRAISLILALAMFLSGVLALSYLLAFSAGWKGWMIMGSGMMAAVGAIWAYSDFTDATTSDTQK